MKSKPLPPLNELKQALNYDAETGEFNWIVSPTKNRKPGPAGSVRLHKGMPRHSISFKGKRYLRSRLAYYFGYGVDPLNCVIDHIDRDTLNDTLTNLRLVDQSVNLANRVCRSKSGIKCISHTKSGKFKLMIASKGYGTFDTLEEAISKRDELRSIMFGDTTTEGKLN